MLGSANQLSGLATAEIRNWSDKQTDRKTDGIEKNTYQQIGIDRVEHVHKHQYTK